MKIRPYVLSAICCLASLGFAQTPLQENMLSHVEKVLVVDSIAVDKDAFFKAYRIQPSAGKILPGKEVGKILSDVKFPVEFNDEPDLGFTNEFNDYLIWAQPDSTGFLRLAESVRLVDDSWSTPQFTSPVLNAGKDIEEDREVSANAAFPFMASDGQTLYFASDNEHSLGGYDIFIAKKDPSDGSFLIPSNMGMPFNSEFDDYMMVIDEQTGTGWWATDRNQLEDQITIYVFALSDERINVARDDENLLSYATLSGWKNLIDEEDTQKREELRRSIASIVNPTEKEYEFTLPAPGGKTLHYYSEFKNPKTAALMRSYLNSQAQLEEARKNLRSLREEYYMAARDPRIGARIEELEQEVREMDESTRELKTEIYKVEFSK